MAITWPVPAILLVALLAITVPLLVRMPLATDVVLYDMQAANIMAGGIACHDYVEPNLPGVVWIHMAVRSLVGTSWEALRIVDILFYAATVGMLIAWQPGRSATRRLWAAFILFWMYTCVSEWNHCQRDIWLLVPALAALHLRARQAERAGQGGSTLAIAGWGLVEGLCWGAGVWLKPFVMVPAICAWVASNGAKRRFAIRAADLAGLVLGGLIVGAAGIAWMVANGAWPAFVETMTGWNPEYAAARFAGWTSPQRMGAMVWRFFPWIFLHLAAIPTAIAALRTTMRARLLATFYLAWLVQSVLVQHLFDYVHLPGIVLAVGMLADWGWNVRWRRAAVWGFCLVAMISSGVFRTDRLAYWCPSEDDMPAEVHARLARLNQVNWVDLQRVAYYLGDMHLADGELTCLNSTLVYLYPMLNLKPSTRFIFLDSLYMFCPSHRPEIERAVQSSRQRYVVADLVTAGVPAAVADRGKSALAQMTAGGAANGSFPWSQEPVFRSGRYVVYRVKPPIGPLQIQLPPPPIRQPVAAL